MPYFICEKSRQKFKLSDEVCTLKKCPFLVDLKCTAQVKKVIKKLEGAKYGGLIPSANKR
jgi:hypothetical protein